MCLKPDSGNTVNGVGPALHELANQGVLHAQVDSRAITVLRLEPLKLRAYRKCLMALDPPVADAFYFGGMDWRARSTTAAKILDKPRVSVTPRS